jgi:hypothetical protein
MEYFGKPQPGAFLKNQTVSDYSHASELFRPNNLELLPKQSFLFHVFFEIDPSVTTQLSTGMGSYYDSRLNVGLLAKRVQLPKFSTDIKVYNAYNRKNIIQQRIKYDPVTITIHDDSANIARNLWVDYYNWYYADARNRSETTYASPTKYDQRNEYDFGFSPKVVSNPALEITNPGLAQQPFFRSVKIYSLHQKKYSEYILVNPVISQWQHGEHQQGQNDFMECSVTLEFETVIYNDNVPSNYIDSELVKNFPPEGLYDTEPRLNIPTRDTVYNQIGRNFLNVVARSVRNPSNFRNNFKNFVKSTATQAVSGISSKVTQVVLSQQQNTDKFILPVMANGRRQIVARPETDRTVEIEVPLTRPGFEGRTGTITIK